jgi:hypothetical protein
MADEASLYQKNIDIHISEGTNYSPETSWPIWAPRSVQHTAVQYRARHDTELPPKKPYDTVLN